MEETRRIKALLIETKAAESGEKVFRFRASTDVLDRQGEIVTVNGWELANYRANPVFMWAHDYAKPPIGKVVALENDDKGLLADVVFDVADDFAQQIQGKYERGILNAVSVGFQPLEISVPKDGKAPTQHTHKELLEISAVPVPAAPDALIQRWAQEVLQADKRAVAPHTMPMADMDTPWDAVREVREAEVADLKIMAAWFDAENPDIKGSYKLPHHHGGGGHEVVWRGVAAAMAVLLGGRGGVNIPDGDRRAVYNHLTRHYRQFDKEPPEFRSLGDLAKLGPEEITGLFWEGEMDDAQKAGRVLSRKNEDAIKQAKQLLEGVLASLGDQEEDDVKALELDVDLSPLEALVKS